MRCMVLEVIRTPWLSVVPPVRGYYRPPSSSPRLTAQNLPDGTLQANISDEEGMQSKLWYTIMPSCTSFLISRNS